MRLRVMVVDDEPDICTILTHILSTDHEVVTATNGLEALERLDRYEPDFIVMDVMMPVLDGIDTTRAIKKDIRYANVPVLFLTARKDNQAVREGLLAGGDVFLDKPFNPPDLLARMQDIVARFHLIPQRKKFTLDEITAYFESRGADGGPRNPETPTPRALAATPRPAGGAVRLPDPPTPAFAPRRPTGRGPDAANWDAAGVAPPAWPPAVEEHAPTSEQVARAAASARVPSVPVRATATAPRRRAQDVPFDATWVTTDGAALRRVRVLIVDDDRDILEYSRSVLEHDFDVIATTDSEAALDKIIAYQPDLLLLDITMPRLSGFHVAQLIRLNRRLRGAKILFVSSHTDRESVERAYRLGASEFVDKPFTPEQLARRVNDIVGRPDFKRARKRLDFAEICRREGSAAAGSA